MKREPIANLDYLIKDIQKNRPAVIELLYGENIVYAAGCKRAGADESEGADIENVINDLKGDFYDTFRGCVLFYKPRRTSTENRTKSGYKFLVAFKDDDVTALSMSAPGTMPQQPVYVNGINSGVDREQLEEEIRSKIMFEIEKENFKKEKEQFEQSKINGTNDDDSITSTLGNISVNFCKVIDSIANVMREVNKSRSMSMQGTAVGIAGVDPDVIPNKLIDKMEDAKTTVEEISKDTIDVQEHVENLLERFSNVEPQWIELLEKVVVMAEKQDTTYTMAKSILLK